MTDVVVGLFALAFLLTLIIFLAAIVKVRESRRLSRVFLEAAMRDRR